MLQKIVIQRMFVRGVIEVNTTFPSARQLQLAEIRVKVKVKIGNIVTSSESTGASSGGW